jgi:hypothetical protein
MSDNADLDGDGHADLVAAMAKRLSLWRGNASGKFAKSVDIPVGSVGNFLVATDWNQDGVLDLLFVTSTLRMLLGRGDGTFDKEIACGLALATEASGNVIADFDHDQKMDMVANVFVDLVYSRACVEHDSSGEALS